MKTIAAQKTSGAPIRRGPGGNTTGSTARCSQDLHLFRATPAQIDDSAFFVVYESFSQQQARRRSNLRKGPGPSLGRKTASCSRTSNWATSSSGAGMADALSGQCSRNLKKGKARALPFSFIAAGRMRPLPPSVAESGRCAALAVAPGEDLTGSAAQFRRACRPATRRSGISIDVGDQQPEEPEDRNRRERGVDHLAPHGAAAPAHPGRCRRRRRRPRAGCGCRSAGWRTASATRR